MNHGEASAQELRRNYDQALDEIGVLEERVRSLRRSEARHLEALERQGKALTALYEYIEGKDLIRASVIEDILMENNP